MNFQHLHTFCTVLTEKSMTAASQKLYLTQPAVSQQIRHLEEEMGVELLVRGVRQVRPTVEGQLLYDYAQKIITLVNQAKVAIQTVGAEVSGSLRVSTLNSIGLHLIGPVFGLFLKNNSNVRLQLRYGEGADVLNLLAKGEVDVAILPHAKLEYGAHPDDCDHEVIMTDEMWLVASPKDRDLPKSIRLKDFGSRPVIRLTREYPGFENMILKELKKAGAHYQAVLESSNVGTLKRALESGLGWGFLPAHSIKKQVQTGRLQRVEVEDFSYPTELLCYLPRSQKTARTTEVFVDALRQLSF